MLTLYYTEQVCNVWSKATFVHSPSFGIHLLFRLVCSVLLESDLLEFQHKGIWKYQMICFKNSAYAYE